MLYKKIEIIEIARTLQRDATTTKKQFKYKYPKENSFWQREKHRIGEEGEKNYSNSEKRPLLTSKQVFEESGLNICSRPGSWEEW